jgi:hypothetical protein
MKVRVNHAANARYGLSNRYATGYVYVAVLFTTLIVMATVTAALSISTATLKGEADRGNRGDSLRLAEAEIQRLAALMRSSTSWRSDNTSGTFTNWYTISVDGAAASTGSQVRARYVDADGDLADDLTDSVALTVHARAGSGETALTVELESDPAPLGLLDYSVTVANDIEFISGTLDCEWPVQVAANCLASSWGILTTPRLEIGGTKAVLVTLRGDQTAASLVLPMQDVVARYVSIGTELSLAALPVSGSDLQIQDIVLSPTINPFGENAANGVYWLDAGGKKVVISNCRLDATLAIKNASAVEINGAVTWSYPNKADIILATSARIEIKNFESHLDESVRNVNFNPTISPYRGKSNTTTTDVYPAELRGLIYTSDDVRFKNADNPPVRLTGAIICGDLKVEGYLTVKQLGEVLSDPPLGLQDSIPMRFVRGSFRRVPSP